MYFFVKEEICILRNNEIIPKRRKDTAKGENILKHKSNHGE